MQVSAGSKSSEDSDEKSTAKQALAGLMLIKNKQLIAPVLIFVLAFALRALYNCVFLEHRIAHFGDAYNFLRSGTCLLEAVLSSHNIFDFLGKIYHASAPQAQLLQSMTSLKLTDRLLIDGPVFPGYLALIEWISGVNAFKPIFDAYSVQLGLCNSFVDAITCVLVYFCGRLAFTRRTALIAGLLFAIYPAAIINTQHCYSEPFSYFLLSIWTALSLFVLLRHSKSTLLKAASWCAIGLSTGMLMLSKPAFILLPPMALAAIVPISLIRQMSHRDKSQSLISSISPLLRKFAGRAALAAIGLAIILTPWMFFNKAVSGQYSVFVNRVPSFNIFHGNQLRTDAWRCYPFYGTFPGDSKLVIASLLEDAKQKPLPFIGLQFKKVARLWSGVWNEYHYSLFGIPLEIQSLFHQLLLLSGTVSLSYLLCRSGHKTLSRSFSAAVLLGTIVVFHFAYIPFEAISRYAITAMPAIILLSASLLEESWRSKNARSAFSILMVVSAAGLLTISSSGYIANCLASVLPVDFLDTAPWLAVLADCICFALSLYLMRKHINALVAGKEGPAISLIIPWAVTLLSCIVAAFYTVQSFDWREWSCGINEGQSVRQIIRLPKTLPDAATAFVLFDMGSDNLAPELTIKLNGEVLSEKPFPLAELQPNNADILQCLAIQAEGMSLDIRSFRNWWVVPCKKSLLRSGEDNSIELSYNDDSAHAIIYGDFQKPADLASSKDGNRYLPSLRSFSYTKGFTTFDHRDPRVFEEIPLEGKTVGGIRISGNKQKHIADIADLSDASGRQYGSYRIRLMIPSGTQKDKQSINASSSREAITLVGDKAQLVVGANPATFVPANPVIKLPDGLAAGTRIYFTCETRSVTGNHPCFVNLSFSGLDTNNEQKVWKSIWQPIGIPASTQFKVTTFSDFIPDDILRLKNLEIKPLFSPCLPDLVFLKRKQAIKSSIEIKNAKLYLLNPLDLPAIESRTWSIY